MNGLWKFNWVRHADARPTDFYQTNFNDKGWDDLQVPGVWELNGYGDPVSYTHLDVYKRQASICCTNRLCTDQGTGY